MNIVFFITHKTLDIDHLNACFYSISIQDDNKKFDRLYIYNTHEQELSNNLILDYYNKYNLNRFFNEVYIFEYDESTHKSLGGDISVIKSFCLNNYNKKLCVKFDTMFDRILLLKSDCLLSKNYFKTILNIQDDKLIYFVAPFVCAKKRVLDKEIFEYIKREKVVFSDNITFFVEDQDQSNFNDFTRRNIDILDEEIKFTSCYVIRDFSCHYITVGLLPYINIEHKSWGGVNFDQLRPFLHSTEDCFVVHKYHEIISENRSSDREGPVKDWLNS